MSGVLKVNEYLHFPLWLVLLFYTSMESSYSSLLKKSHCMNMEMTTLSVLILQGHVLNQSCFGLIGHKVSLQCGCGSDTKIATTECNDYSRLHFDALES